MCVSCSAPSTHGEQLHNFESGIVHKTGGFRATVLDLCAQTCPVRRAEGAGEGEAGHAHANDHAQDMSDRSIAHFGAEQDEAKEIAKA